MEILPPSTAPSSQNAVTMPVLEESANEWPGSGNPMMVSGSAQLSAAVVTVFTTEVHPTSQIFLTYQNADLGTAGFLSSASIFDGTQFDIASSNGADNNVVCWLIVNNP